MSTQKKDQPSKTATITSSIDKIERVKVLAKELIADGWTVYLNIV